MTQTEIRRLKIAPLATEPEFPSLAQEASELLGYNPEALGNPTPKPDELFEALRELEIEILDWRDVRRYQVAKRHEVEAQALEAEVTQDSPMPGWRRFEYHWNETEISKFGRHIPAHVLQKAIEIKKRLPSVFILVEELTGNSDPFLVVTIDPKRWSDVPRYYIEVWDEAKFEGQP